MWGIVPAAGKGTRIQPLAFSKELLPVGARKGRDGEHPRAVSEYIVERMLGAGASHLCFVISPGKSDILAYYPGRTGTADCCFVVQPEPAGLCDAVFRALPFLPDDDEVLVGLPDTIWFPDDALAHLPSGVMSFLCFPVQRPEQFDAVIADATGRVREIQVKTPDARSNWIWGAFRLTTRQLRELHALWLERERRDPYFGTLVNAWLARGGEAWAVKAGEVYLDVGTLEGYREAMRVLEGVAAENPSSL